MSIAVCDYCGAKDEVRVNGTRLSYGARRRSYVCRKCGRSFTTLEVRLPAGMGMGILQAKLKEWVKKEASK
jgi:DNA-directed RNA polymerase subunit RPC12/RpoP